MLGGGRYLSATAPRLRKTLDCLVSHAHQNEATTKICVAKKYRRRLKQDNSTLAGIQAKFQDLNNAVPRDIATATRCRVRGPSSNSRSCVMQICSRSLRPRPTLWHDEQSHLLCAASGSLVLTLIIGLGMSLASHIDFESLAVFAGEERVGLGIADDFSLDGIPLQFAAQAHRNVGEVADFEHAVV